MEWWDYDFLALEIFWRSISGCQRRLWRRWSWPSYHVNTMRLYLRYNFHIMYDITHTYIFYPCCHWVMFVELETWWTEFRGFRKLLRLGQAANVEWSRVAREIILEMCRGLWTWKGVEGGNFMAVVLCHWHAKCSSWTGATRSSSVGAALRIFMISSCGLVSLASWDLVFALRCFMSRMWRSSQTILERTWPSWES